MEPINYFSLYLSLGWDHIVSREAADHILFLAALVAPYTLADRKFLIGLVTSFTIGHSITLILSSFGWRPIPVPTVEVLIPVTIVLTGSGYLVHSIKGHPSQLFFVLAGFFGLFHGLGFSGTLESLLGKKGVILIPLAGFNLGIELGQIFILSLFLTAKWVSDRFFPGTGPFWFRIVSFLSCIGGLWMVWERTSAWINPPLPLPF